MNVRTGFACAGGEPLSVGSARLALVNWLLARGQGGGFVLRAGSPAAVEILRWLGLDWDVGPERLPDRDAECRSQAERLTALGLAYRCYCASAPCRGVCRDLSPTRERAFEMADRHFRLYLDGAAVPPAAGQDEGFAARSPDAPHDMLLLDAGGMPGPLLARVVDDHLDEITHIVVDARWLPDSPAEQALYRALDWQPPHLAYLPSPEPGMAGRHLAGYRERGYGALPLANYLARLGWAPHGRRRLLSLSELAAQFDLHGTARRAAAFDEEQLNWFNRRWLDSLDDEAYLAQLRPHWWRTYGQPDRASGTTLAPGAWQRRLAAMLRGQVHLPSEAAALVRPLFVDRLAIDEDAARLLAQPWAGAVLHAFIEGLPAVVPFVFEPLDRWISALRWQFKEQEDIRSRDVMYMLRAALTGQPGGPCLIEDCLLLGRTRCLARASAALAVWEELHG